MGAQLIERALAEWRDGERLLRDLPRNDPEYESVRLAVIDLRETYRCLAQPPSDAPDQTTDFELRIDAAHDAIAAVRSRFESAA